MEQGDFVKGALIGGCVGTLVAFFVAPKSGKKLREDISKSYYALRDQSNEYIDEIKEQAQDALETMQGKEENPQAFFMGSIAGAIVGALAGLLLAPQAGYKLREKLGEEYEEMYKKAQQAVEEVQKTGHDWEDKLEEWKEVFMNAVDKLSPSTTAKSVQRKAQETGHKLEDWRQVVGEVLDKLTSSKNKKHADSTLEDILDWANLGLRFYNQMQARR